MKIVRIRVLEFHRQLDGRTWNPVSRWTRRSAPLLAIETDAGLTGLGEAWCRQDQVSLVLERLASQWAPVLLGSDPQLLHALAVDAQMTDGPVEAWVAAAAASAVDIALWDLRAQAAGVPLWRHLGGQSARVAVYASGGLYRDGTQSQDLAHEFAGHAQFGFTAMKMKVGALGLAADLERVCSVREAIGGDRRLWVDAVNQLTRDSAPAWCEALAQAGVAAIQAPLPFDDIGGMARVNAHMLPVIADETQWRDAGFRALLDANAVSHLQFCLGLCGGFSGALRIDDAAASHAVATTPQCHSTAILQAASLHFGAARRNVDSVEYHRFHDHLSDMLPTAMRRINDGYVDLDDQPGLGIGRPALGMQADGSEIRVYRSIALQHQTSHS
ncbi:MAG: enolase C-terminal domain-like protein [Casimicrobiaceae bacterium]